MKFGFNHFVWLQMLSWTMTGRISSDGMQRTDTLMRTTEGPTTAQLILALDCRPANTPCMHQFVVVFSETCDWRGCLTNVDKCSMHASKHILQHTCSPSAPGAPRGGAGLGGQHAPGGALHQHGQHEGAHKRAAGVGHSQARSLLCLLFSPSLLALLLKRFC